MDSVVALATRGTLGMVELVTSPRLSILMFHRVHAEVDPIFPLELEARRFERWMQVIARSYRVMSLGEAAAAVARGAIPPRAMVITFDDGYADNAEVALPILARHGLVATFFVASGYLDGGCMWNDIVIESIRACTRDSVDLESFGLGKCVLGAANERRALIETLMGRIKFLGLAERAAAVESLRRACGVDRLPNSIMMRSDQVRQLHEAGMEIGGHTAGHPVLSTLTTGEGEREIAQGRDQLEAIIDAPVEVFAYPHGKPVRDYDARHVEAVRRLGFKAAVCTASGVARAGADIYQLPRLSPWGGSLAFWAARMVLNRFETRYQTVEAFPVRAVDQPT